MSKHTSVFGLGWGDEGKGKVVDLLCPKFDLVVRYNGGANAGHTVCVGNESFALHLLPSGVLHDAMGVIGPGVVIDPMTLLGEIDGLQERGVEVISKLKISDRAHLVLHYHKLEDQLSEKLAGEGKKIGTTARGIGPCYADKCRRTTAIRVIDLLDEKNLAPRVEAIVTERKAWFQSRFGEDGGLNVDSIRADLHEAARRLGPLVCDSTSYLHEAMEKGKSILFEGANGMLLDLDHGTYPFVTSSSTGPHGIGPGAGVPVTHVSTFIGVCKAYSTRVGSGPFVSELDNELGEQLRQQGKEFGTTTGRPRRCGWFDMVTTRYAVRLSGTTDVAMMHLDTLSGLDKIGICTAYRLGDETITTLPADARKLEQAQPVIEFLDGWGDNLRELRHFEELPQAAKVYLKRIETLLGVPVSLVGVGPERSQVLVREGLRPLIDLPQSSNVP